MHNVKYITLYLTEEVYSVKAVDTFMQNLINKYSNLSLVFNKVNIEDLIFKKQTIIPFTNLAIFVLKDVNYLKEVSNIIDQLKIRDIPLMLLDINLQQLEVILDINKFDYIACCNIKQKTYYSSIGFDEKKIFIVGNPIIDYIKVNLDNNKELLSQKRKILVNLYDLSSSLVLRYVLLLETLICQGFSLKIIGKKKDIRKILNTRLKKQVLLKSHFVTIGLESRLFDYLLEADYVISNFNDLLIYSILLNKPTACVESNLITNLGIYQIDDYKKIDFEKFKINISEESLLYFLINFLPCCFDNKNSDRLDDLLKFIFISEKAVTNYKERLLDDYIKTHPQFKDPLVFIKEEQEKKLNGVTIYE